jgi:hypothetical protein
MKKYILVLVMLVFLFCKRAEEAASGLSFYFENPQPINDAELSKIPNKFQGLFMNSDSLYLNVKQNVVLKESYDKFRFAKSEFDSIKLNFEKVGEKYISKFNKDVFDCKYFKDSIEFSNKRIDTFFIFSNKNKAKRFDGKLVLNYKDSIYWTIKSIRLENNNLKIRCIYSEEGLKRIDSLTKVKSTMVDSSSFIIKPSRNEFKRILNLKKLGEEFEYKKVQNEVI